MRSTRLAKGPRFSYPPMLCVGGVVWATALLATTGLAVEFTAQVIDPQPGKVVYAVAVEDIDGDGADDIIAVTENRVLWYQAPDWKPHVILDGVTQSDNVCVAPLDIDRDGQIDLALGAGWPQSGGTVQWLSRGENVNAPWQLHAITAEPWTHRMRWSDVLGKGEPQLVVSPLNATVRPDGVRLLALEIPSDPRTDRWQPTLLNGELNRMHNHWCVDPDAIGMSTETAQDRPVTLTASEEGISVVAPAAGSANRYRRIPLLAGAQGDEASQRGAGEVKTGQLAGGTRFLATIEPMHGTHAVVYPLPDNLFADLPDDLSELVPDEKPDRIVLTDDLRGGHALWCADLDQDGSDEIVVGYRDPNPAVGILVFDHQQDGTWAEQRVGDEVACEDLIVADVNGDGWLDIIAGGRATHNVVVYLNQGDE
ncbi:FG-GAP repeat domain-containing protein [Allorhodopirellula solitaria]|uniref:FG-GAP repeat protein n=1 Tax=Allorhodopirellula solitaria TaxID=2527987 RepID=A0A5C5YDG6_9BACT|nr:VCBS repeat-containing protein [Allorhodopirellula solitaria]TWT73400.1 FG-GAP repeat protein [Allorhodopirellula solitaria]